MHLLLIEDDLDLGQALQRALKSDGLTSEWIRRVGDVPHAFHGRDFDCILLDLGLPDEDGMALLRRWRTRRQDLPVLVLTARDAVEHRVAGLQAGADDYVLKPFDLDELVARLHALLRRACGRSTDRIEHGALTFQASTGEVQLHGASVELSRRELALLRTLLQHPRQILSSDHLRDSLYGFDQYLESNAVNVHIHHLRRKLGASIVETVRGQGYRLGDPIS